MAYSLTEVLRHVVSCEESIKTAYHVMARHLCSRRSRKIVEFLTIEQEKILGSFRAREAEHQNNVEFIEHMPEFHEEAFCPIFGISIDATPEELLGKVFALEKHLKDYYSFLKDAVIYTRSKELFDMMIVFKSRQIKALKVLIDTYALVH